MTKKKISRIKNDDIRMVSQWNWGSKNENTIYDAIIKIENKINEIVDYLNKNDKGG